MPMNYNPGCKICGKPRHTATELCADCLDHWSDPPKPKKKDQDVIGVRTWAKGQNNTIDCNHCYTDTHCNGEGIIPAGSCRKYVPHPMALLGYRA